jgi:hypothetical protein
MATDPWSRPSVREVQRVLESLGRSRATNSRAAERLELCVPAELTTSRGNSVSVMTREISRWGVGLIHRGAVPLGEGTLRLPSETRPFGYRVQIEWCNPCDEGMFLSGGRFLHT